MMKKKHRSIFKNVRIRTKLLLVIIPLVCLTMGAAKSYDYFTRQSDLEESVKDDMLHISELTATRLQVEIAKAVSAVETAADNRVFLSQDQSAIIQELNNIKNQNPLFATVFLSDASLTRINEQGDTASLADREYMQEVKKTGETVVSNEILISQATKEPAIMIATPIKISGAPESYLGVSLDTKELKNIVAGMKKSDSNYSFAFDGKDGLVFAHPVEDYVGSLKFINPDEKDKGLVAPELTKMVQEAVSGHSGTQIYEFNGVKVIAAYANVPGTSFGVASRMKYYDAMESVRKEQISAIVITLIATAVGVAAAFGLSVLIATPIKRIAIQANIIASGDFTQAITLDAQGKDEISQLQQAFKDMAIKLGNTMEQIGQATKELASSSEVLEISTEQSAQGSNQVAETVAEVALGASEQVQAVDQTAYIVTGIGREIGEIENLSFEVAELSGKAAATTQDGEKAIQRAVTSITTINEIVQDTATAIRDLNSSSEQISQIVTTITGIASSTNLLALNASIEAARAGEQGRGFTVVAEQVSKLAQQSKEAASNIASIIEGVLIQTRYAIQKMESSAHEVSNGTEVVLEAGEAFQGIQQQINNVDQAVQKITQNVKHLSNSSASVIASVDKIKEISQETAAGSQTISAATQEQSAVMLEVASSAETLAKLSGQLEETLNQYKF
jgi:methyl-accepting chemotaxis protein